MMSSGILMKKKSFCRYLILNESKNMYYQNTNFFQYQKILQ